ncbi:hypothetical protein K438DRAFT_1801316 [Mycena galopus ATCC 62051]|nr:hypothetical protein K438DRAFT_1801316 [Mycena galopus ATCC 62051]
MDRFEHSTAVISNDSWSLHGSISWAGVLANTPSSFCQPHNIYDGVLHHGVWNHMCCNGGCCIS